MTIKFENIAGITIIANGIELNYPFEICIHNMLDCCKKVFICTDINNRDNTLEKLQSLQKEYENRLKIIQTEWDWTVNNGTDLAYQANICLNHVRQEKRFDGVLYLQADEIIKPENINYIQRNFPLANFVFTRLYYWQDLNHIKQSWTMALPRLCILTPDLKVVEDGMSMHVDHAAGQYITIPVQECPIYHYSRIGNTKLIAKRLNVLDSLFHKTGTYTPLDNYTFGINNNFEQGADKQDILNAPQQHPKGIREFYYD